ncbi:MAG: SIS domain-containing protein [Chitinophagaceae bacterium]|nr:SIS domain-containing protein [Chitinophagaceae bacterium]
MPFQTAASLLREAKYIYISAIGASWNAGIAIQAAFNNVGVPCFLCDASEFLHFTHIPPESAVIFLSRSGRSIEIVNALPKCRLANASIISITNSGDSILAAGSDICLLTQVDFDHSISVSTYTSLILTGQLLALQMKELVWTEEVYISLRKSFLTIRDSIPSWIEIINSSTWLDENKHTYFIARGMNIASAHESMLLWEEGAKQPAAALTTGSFRHGPQEIVNDSINIAIWMEDTVAQDFDRQLVNDLKDNGVGMLSIGFDLPESLRGIKISMPPVPKVFNPVINIIPMQIASEKLALMKNEDPDNFKFCDFVVEKEGGL